MSKEFAQGMGKYAIWPDVEHAANLGYSDVMLVPQISDIESRSHVDTSVKFGPFTLDFPVVSAPMDTISGPKMARALAKAGGIGTLPRGDIAKVSAESRDLAEDGIPFIASIGLKNGYDHASQLHDNGAEIILIDVAHGGMRQVMDLATEVRTKLDVTVMAGNIVTYEQAQAYKDAGIDMARVGVGPGGLCSTRLVAGTGYPQLSAIFETTSAGIYVIADGGIREPGDVAKALAAGADAVMIGSLFAGTEETPGEVDENGMKAVRGQASEAYMNDNGVVTGEYRSAEGISTKVKAQGSVIPIVHEIAGGVRSAMSYAGAPTMEEFKKRGRFVTVSPSTHQFESVPHIEVHK